MYQSIADRMKKTAKISHLFLAANDPPGQKLFTATIVKDQKLCTSYSYIECELGSRAIEWLSSVNWIEGYRVQPRFRNSKKRARTRAESDLKRFWQDSNLNQCKEWAYFLGVRARIGEVMPGSDHLSRNDRGHIEGWRSIFGDSTARGGPFKRL